LSPTHHFSDREIFAQVERLEASQSFAGSERLLQFMRFIVAETLKGNASTLKEAVIGNVIYRRDPPYDPRIDSTVRVEARRLRRKLEDYYLSEGRSDPIRILLPTGSYVPDFEAHASAENEPSPMPAPTFEPGRGAMLAIMPFRALSHEPADEVFADGLTDDVIYMLGQAEGLRVTSRSVVFQFKKKDYSIPAVAQEFAADALLQGTVRHDANRLLITVDLCDPRGFVLWSDRFEDADQDKTRLQLKVARTLLSRVRIDHSDMRAMKVKPGPTTLEANAKIYRGRRLADQQTPASLAKALEFFNDVCRSAPDYSRGFSGVIDCQCDLYRLGVISHQAALAAATPALQRALQIDPKSAEVHTSRGTVAAWLQRDVKAADEAFRMALEFGDNARTLRLYGDFLATLDRDDEAHQFIEEARAIDAFSVHQDIVEASAYFRSGQFARLMDDKCERHAESLMYRVLALVFSGKLDAAEGLLPQLKSTIAKFPHLLFAEAEIAAQLGRPEQALALLARQSSEAAFSFACLASAVGDFDQALTLLEKAAQSREASLIWLKHDHRFEKLKELPRFQSLVG